MKKKYQSFVHLSPALLSTFSIQQAFAQDSSSSASAMGLFIEPAITYETSTTDINYPPPLSNSSGEIYGLGLSAKAGVHVNEVIFLGVDFRYAMPKFNDSSVDYNAQAVSTNWGPIVGMQMPL